MIELTPAVVSTTVETKGLTVEEENKALGKQLNIDKAVLDICHKKKMEIMRCVKCPILKECPHPKTKLKPLLEKADKVAEAVFAEELELDDTEQGKLKAQQIRKAVYERYVNDNAYEYLKNERCIFERKEVLTNLQKFVDAGYDITDPRTYIIINELVNNILNSGRLSKSFTSMGAVFAKISDEGTIYIPAPGLKLQMEISQFLIQAIEALDRILKSDDANSATKDFTEHLLKMLDLKGKQKHQIKDKFDDNSIIELKKDDND